MGSVQHGGGGRSLTRRQLIKRLAAGSAVAWLTPIATSVGSSAEAACESCQDPEPFNGYCAWTCGNPMFQCGAGCGPFEIAYCSHDTDGNCWCWEDDSCASVID